MMSIHKNTPKVLCLTFGVQFSIILLGVYYKHLRSLINSRRNLTKSHRDLTKLHCGLVKLQ